jgi:hypothetical protein
MDIAFLLDELRQVAPVAVLVLGFALLWRGLRGGPRGARGLLRPQAGSLGRAEGWRMVVVGLTVIGLGLSGILDARWLFFLSLAFGFVETLEATMVIAAWRAGNRRSAANPRLSSRSLPTPSRGTAFPRRSPVASGD